MPNYIFLSNSVFNICQSWNNFWSEKGQKCKCVTVCSSFQIGFNATKQKNILKICR